MFQAFAVAFGKPAPYATLDDGGDRVVYSPQALIDVAPTVVALVSKGELPGGCEACAGALTIHYLKHGPLGFSRIRTWAGVGGRGRFGAVLPWTVRNDIDNGPTLVTREEVSERGCSATTEELITLTPKGPVKIAAIVISTVYTPTPDAPGASDHLSGKIEPIVRGERFAVVLTGTETVRQMFKREGDVFATRDPGATGC